MNESVSIGSIAPKVVSMMWVPVRKGRFCEGFLEGGKTIIGCYGVSLIANKIL